VKTCFKCGIEKPREEFYRHPQMGDGLLGKCKECTKLDMRIDRVTKPRVREYDRDRAKLPHRIALSKRVGREWDAKFPERVKAHNAAQRSSLPSQKPICCEGCGLPKDRLEKHHHDYSRPLLIVWLCKPCHAIADKIRRRLEAS
jgi:hypothetical protein